MRMPQELKTKWIEALESGEYKQGQHVLCNDGAYCCLGVLQHIVDGDVERSVTDESLTMPTEKWYASNGIELKELESPRWKWEDTTLSALNDDGMNFEDIANFILRKVEGY